MICAHRTTHVLQSSTTTKGRSNADCLAEELQQQVQALEHDAGRDFDDIYGCEADYSIPDSIFSHSSYSIFDDTDGLIQPSYPDDGEFESLGAHKPASEKYTLPRWNSTSTQQLSSCGGSGELITWKGCQKSAWCDRLDRHPGLCNNKASVPGSVTYDNSVHDQISEGEPTGCLESDGDFTHQPTEGELSGSSSAKYEPFGSLARHEDVEHNSAWNHGSGSSLPRQDFEGTPCLLKQRSRSVSSLCSGRAHYDGVYTSDSQEPKSCPVRNSVALDDSYVQSGWLSPRLSRQPSARVVDGAVEAMDQVDHLEQSGSYGKQESRRTGFRRAEDVPYVSLDNARGPVAWSQHLGQNCHMLNSSSAKAPIKGSTTNLTLLDTQEAPLRTSSVSSSSFSSLSPNRSSFVANLLEKIRSKPGYEHREGDGPNPQVNARSKKRSAPSMKSPAPNPNGHSCTQCGTQSTPVWRAGPHGPKTLCNACGVRYMKVAKKR